MTTLLQLLLVLFLLLLLIAAVLPFSCPSCSRRKKAADDVCPVSGRPATQRNVLRHGGKCYRVGTCSKGCHEALQLAQAKDERAFTEAFSLLWGHSAGSPGVHLRHPETKDYLQFAPEVSCA